MAVVSETRYIVTIRTDAAHGLEIVLGKAEPTPESSVPVLVSVFAPYPWGPRGFEVTSVERIPRDGTVSGAVEVWPAS